MQCKSLFSAKELEVGFKFDWFAENSHYYIIETTLNSTNCNHAIAEVLNDEMQREQPSRHENDCNTGCRPTNNMFGV